MGIITPTFADKPRVEAEHEPISETLAPVGLRPYSATTAPLVAPPPAQITGLRTTKVALVGTAPSSRMLAPFNDQSWTIWACSPGNMNILPRFDAWFEVHGNLLFPECESYGKPYIEFLKNLKCPVFVLKNYYSFPNAEIIPWWNLIRDEEFGRDFFTSSFAWMMAEAMRRGAKEIELYGIDMASRDEYILQRPGFYHFRREALKRGVRISAPHESDIMQSPALYGLADTEPFGRKILARKMEVKSRIGQMEGELQKHQTGTASSITYLKGALEDIDYFDTIWMGLGNQVSILEAENARLKEELGALRAPPVLFDGQKGTEQWPTIQSQTRPV